MGGILVSLTTEYNMLNGPTTRFVLKNVKLDKVFEHDMVYQLIIVHVAEVSGLCASTVWKLIFRPKLSDFTKE